MDAYKAILTKRDRREYDGRPISDEATRRILQAGRMAGSSSNRQPCSFIVLNDAAVREALAPAGRGTATMVTAPLSIAIILRADGTGFDVGRVAQNMMVAAWADGIASCPQGVQDQAVARAALGLPDDQSVGMCLAFGYLQPGPSSREARPRTPYDEIVHMGRW